MRPIKYIGAAALAMLAISVVAPSLATAREFTADSYPATLKGSKHTELESLVTTSGTVACSTVTSHGTISGPATALTLRPTFGGCTGFGFPATIDVNSCQYVNNISAGESMTGDLDIVCPAGQSITITAISAGTVKCTVHIGSQSDLTGTVTYSNTGSGSTKEVTLSREISGLDYSHTKGTGLGACTAGSATNGTMSGRETLTAANEITGIHVGLFTS